MFQKLAYSLLCIVLVVALLSFQPGGSNVMIDVDEELLQQAEDAGLLNAEIPVGADSKVFNGVMVDGTLVGEVYFSLNGVNWVYRCGIPGTDGITDLSGLDSVGIEQETDLQGCPATICCNDDGTGKIFWEDPDTGAAYSLTMSTQADADVLYSIANLMYAPIE